MFDLIYYNPENGQRMAVEDEDDNNPDEPEANKAAERRGEGVDLVVDEDSVKTEDDEAMPAPRVKVGPNGEIILDEASTVVETKAAKEAKKNIELSPIVVEKTNRATNYGTWSKKRKHSDWSDRETLKFYRALSMVGTDFSMMASLFGKKTRQELKLKFKKEEKINGPLIDRCLTSRSQQGQYINLEDFVDEEEEESGDGSGGDEPEERKTKKRGRTKQKQRPRKLRKGSRRTIKNRGYYSSSDADDDRSPVKTEPNLRHLPPLPAPLSPAALAVTVVPPGGGPRSPHRRDLTPSLAAVSSSTTATSSS